MQTNVIHLTRQPTATTTTPHTCAPALAQEPQGCYTVDPVQAHQEAENALAMALHYLRSGAGNIPGAARKAVQALAALRQLQAPQ